MFRIEVENKKKQIQILIKTKDPLDALDLAHAVMFSATLRNNKVGTVWKVLP